MTFFDFIFKRLLHTVFPRSTAEKAHYERRPDGVRPTHGRTAQIRIRQVRRRYGGNHHVRSLPTYEQFLVMAFAQLTYRESLRDITTCLRAVGSKLYHSGIRQPVARSTLADANEKRDWRIFADFAHDGKGVAH